MKIVAHCAVWVLAFCAVLASPVVLIFGVPLAIGIGADIVDSGAGPPMAVLIATAAACIGLRRPSARALAKKLLHLAAPIGTAKRVAAGAPQAAKSIS